jgi:hypothetical protein
MTEKPFVDFEVLTTATFPYFLMLNSIRPPTSVRVLLAAKSMTVLPFFKVLTPVAAIAGIAVRAATAALPQINVRLVSACT